MIMMRTATRRGRRWRGAAILLSVAWFVGLAVFAWSSGIRSNGDFLHRQLASCLVVLERTERGLQDFDPTRRDDRRSANWARFKGCETRAELLFNQVATDQSEAVPLVLMVDFLTVLIGWLCIGSVVLLARRFGRGFAPG
jgi:hypothetical protein